jgi:hypothetical protein
VTACASSEKVAQPVNPATVGGYSVRPIVRYVLDAGQLDAWEGFYEWLGEPEYDERFRSPLWPVGATLADCDKAWRLGVVVDMQWPANIRVARNPNQSVPLKFEWTVPSRETGTRKLQEFHTSYGGFYIDEIALDTRQKIDGLYKVSVQLRGVELYQTSFELVGCEDGPYHPPWYEPMRGPGGA